MAEADVVIDKAIDTGEVFDSPVGLGLAAGTDEPFPYRMRMPVEGKAKDEWPVAIFWLHPFDLAVAAKLREQGINPDPSIADLAEIAAQNRALSQLLIDKSKGWSNLFRVDGSQWVYRPCSKDDEATHADPRVRISEVGSMFALLKARCISAAFTISSMMEGNSDSSSDSPMVGKDEPSERPSASPVS